MSILILTQISDVNIYAYGLKMPLSLSVTGKFIVSLSSLVATKLVHLISHKDKTGGGVNANQIGIGLG